MKKQDKKTEEKIINAEGKTLGRVASEIAFLLMGKTRASFERHIYSGLKVKVINASKIKITVKKLEEIYHTRYSGYRGGLRILKGTETVEKKGLKELIKLAVYHMLPGNKLRKEMMKNLKIED
ncbi:MAG: 50S ribosomal protein L13 [Candidatus Nomurabacteria bacterium GW2011_GWF2_35_12]|uniref:50S ribosomal protein L13 n=3 Tax=Candidatus Nomuraibacteriota TaxID=1752729 RepID=A0A0G0H2W6_9BACT|nr:MAG: 50S ribosomal protein L13 [Candidatus Nomurabacteria bacterium GW2011_GWF2_35_12]KKP72196.1 MAG: 50S ribosomal protein L13 [Candidatus Nomurabacteria bacterium GW2011_GWB1_35_20]KKP74716.1 MAG: 50S ribosomal protein L13 [Parcubacteria group bacterium GW2011_GWC1_35_21]KKP77963.1 MAG: 50S ribosomal protein L13 [Candidatus Nomurabacteria bacterium GW2011_GWC2_35_35]KKP85257.1 MAG: 50S ribosomal protein L13 [Parcubacteria group bacterium GW2011_GWD2_35_7]KKP87615.1 MAG: 50S ribosomal prot